MLEHITNTLHFKKILIAFFIGMSIIFWFGIWLYGQYYISTDDAYINANVVQIAPRVTGQVNRLYVLNNQYVQENQPLFDIDQAPFQANVNKAEAQLAINQAAFVNANISEQRTLSIVKKKFLSEQAGDNSIAALHSAEASVQLAKATLQEAQLNLSWTTLTAPTSGWVTNISLRSGANVLANQPIFALISDKEFWIDANFKETNIAKIKRGQLATIHVDMYPNHPFKGYVESISGGAGAAFSLLPPQNATGNWVKVTQRVPVRIHVINPDMNYPLRIGTSVAVTINLHQSIKQIIHAP